MTVGLPGAGIGGLFYILSAIAMPVRELLRLLRHAVGGAPDPRSADEVSTARRLALRQGAIALGIGGALWVTGAALGRLLLSFEEQGRPGITTLAGFQRVLPASAFVMTFGSLALVLLAAEIARHVIGSRRSPAPPPVVAALAGAGARVSSSLAVPLAVATEAARAAGSAGPG